MSKNGVTLKTRLGVVQGHSKWRRSIDHMLLSIGRRSAIVNIAAPMFLTVIGALTNLQMMMMMIIEIGAIRKLGWGFLFAFYSNYGRTCSRL